MEAQDYSDRLWQNWTNEAEATIEADEKAGVLMLVEQKGKFPINYAAWARSALSFIKYKKQDKEFTDFCGGWECPIDSEDLERANTPVYQCKKE